MIFLIHYDRRNVSTLLMKTYPDADRATALHDHLELELVNRNNPLDTEIVMLEGPSEAHVRKTHARYFPGAMREAIRELTAA